MRDFLHERALPVNRSSAGTTLNRRNIFGHLKHAPGQAHVAHALPE
jgi:hypothetical protein